MKRERVSFHVRLGPAMPDFVNDYWPIVVGLTSVLYFLLVAAFIVWVLMSKAETSSAVAWCLLLIFLPLAGMVFFLVFGYQHVRRPLNRKRRHRQVYADPPHPKDYSSYTQWAHLAHTPPSDADPSGLAALAIKFGASPVTQGNRVDFYADGPPAFEAMLEAIRNAKHHIHLEFFIVHADQLGQRILLALIERAQHGVHVRLLYDAVGSRGVSRKFLGPLEDAGGETCAFLSLSILRRRFQVNMRNHRKILIVDGEIGFVGGLNIGDEYVGRSKYFGYWRDTHLRIRGPAVVDLQRVFVEDWDFSAEERLADAEESLYFRAVSAGGTFPLQIVDSGPDQDYKAIREVLFAALLKAKRRLWIATPYFVPDSGLLDAVRLAAFSGVDVRILFQLKPDKWVPYFAGCYYFENILAAGVKIHQYAKGMMHAKVVIIDDDFASVGSANFDNRSMFLNFEVNCLMYSTEANRILGEMFERDIHDSIQIEPAKFARRSFYIRLAENACRLMSPVL